jgi:hypothetical protein
VILQRAHKTRPHLIVVVAADVFLAAASFSLRLHAVDGGERTIDEVDTGGTAVREF